MFLNVQNVVAVSDDRLYRDLVSNCPALLGCFLRPPAVFWLRFNNQADFLDLMGIHRTMNHQSTIKLGCCRRRPQFPQTHYENAPYEEIESMRSRQINHGDFTALEKGCVSRPLFQNCCTLSLPAK
jgi:hypothetical protein